MQLADFQAMVDRLAANVPPEFLDGVAGVEVSPKTLPHPTRAGIFTLGECIPIPAEGDPGPGGVQSRVVLYHGSFRALARGNRRFAWREEAWETLTHELRHHLEWRARAPDLEAFDDAAEENFARAEGEPFDPLFHLDAERVAEGVYRIDDDFFLDRVVRDRPETLAFAWHGSQYELPVPALDLPLFLTVTGVANPPPGDLVLVLRREPGLGDLLRRPGVPLTETVSARRLAG